MSRFINLTGKTFGDITVLKLIRISKGVPAYLLKCKCGNEYIKKGSGNVKQIRNCRKCCGILKRNPLAAIKLMYRNYKSAPTHRKLTFNISFKDFVKISSKNCYWCGSQPKLIKSARGVTIDFANGLDRKDNDLGYTIKNCIPCCSTCNYMRIRIPFDDYKNHMKQIAKRWGVK